MADPLRHLDVCAGIGGFSLGLRLALGAGVHTVGYIEREAYAAAVLLARMEDETLERAPVWCGPLEDVGGSELRGEVDILTAGFPCQPYSLAGKLRRDADDRAIWPAIAALIEAAAPALVFLENVDKQAFRQPWRDLRGMGYTVPHPVVVSAAELGAGHLRRRWFVIAYRDEQGRPREPRAGVEDARGTAANSNGAGIWQQPGRGSGTHGAGEAWAAEATRNRNGQGRPQPAGCQSIERRRAGDASWWQREPRVERVVLRLPHGVDRHRTLGLAVLPQMVAKAWEELVG